MYCIWFICQIVPPGLLSTSTSICMSKAAESLRSNQPQRHSLSAQCLPRAAEASSSAFGESESKSLYRSPMGGEESSYSNSVENASTHRGTVTHSWDNKYHSETHDPSANWDQSMNFVPIHDCHQADSPQKANESLSPCFRMAIWKSESVCHVIQDVVYRTTEENGWGETVWAYEMHSLEDRLQMKQVYIVFRLLKQFYSSLSDSIILYMVFTRVKKNPTCHIWYLQKLWNQEIFEASLFILSLL